MEILIDRVMTRRLIVLINDCQANNQELAHAIHWMAYHDNLSVLYLVIVENDKNRVAISRDMATMKAVTSANRLQVDVTLTQKDRWWEDLHNLAGSNDIVICQEEQTIPTDHFRVTAVSDFLANRLASPVRTISGYYQRPYTCEKKQLPEPLVLLGFLAILAGFTWMQVRLDLAFDSTEQVTFILASFSIEMWAIWTWYRFTC